MQKLAIWIYNNIVKATFLSSTFFLFLSSSSLTSLCLTVARLGVIVGSVSFVLLSWFIETFYFISLWPIFFYNFSPFGFILLENYCRWIVESFDGSVSIFCWSMVFWSCMSGLCFRFANFIDLSGAFSFRLVHVAKFFIASFWSGLQSVVSVLFLFRFQPPHLRSSFRSEAVIQLFLPSSL